MSEEKACTRCGKVERMYMYQTMCSKCQREHELELRQQAVADAEEGEQPDTWSSDYVICPWCGDADEASAFGWCDFREAYEEGSHDMECGACGRKYTLVTSVLYSWETERR